MITIYGKKNCGACLMAKSALLNKKIEFEYVLLEDLDSENYEKIIDMASANKMMNLPIIIKDGNQVKLQEVL